jgi:hypothetical protein
MAITKTIFRTMHPNVMVVRAVNSQVGISSRLEQPDFWKFGFGCLSHFDRAW